MTAPTMKGGRSDRAPWNFAVELEHTIPHQIALPDLDASGLHRVLACMADRFTPEGNSTLVIERVGRPGTVRMDLTTMRWVAEPCGTEGRGILELGCWLRRGTIMGARAAIFGYLLLRDRH